MSRFHFTLQEFSGALADLGVMVPLVILLIVKNGMNPTAILVVAGLLYIVSGVVFRVPVPVQPLKAVSIIAIASGLAPSVIAAAGIIMGGILLLFSVTGVSAMLSRIFSRAIVRGIQLGVGVLLVANGVKMIVDPKFLRGGETAVVRLAGLDVPMGVLFAIAGAAVVIIFSSSRRLPAALALMLFGIASGLYFGSYTALHKVVLAPTPITLAFPTAEDFTKAFFLLVLPQLPLTFGNSIVATADTARAYFGARACGLTPGRLSLSLGVTNLIAGVVGAAPLCHGAGGMSAHYRFGARSGAMGVMLGGCLVLIGALFGRSAPDLFVLLPPSILGVMLVFIGVEHAMLMQDVVDSRKDLFITLAIGTIAGTTANIFAATAIGFFLVILFKAASAGGAYTESAT
ncbi:putative sulfate/molybdate transporter [Geomonas azotofigens]|uniref:putative sulfate/molybdate transporter n=1 Tax=Geomonas azotofigens TaxID=2843196 RepID=UPI001C12966E|nr:putative sulfate/molybdate transporter [Geomonas azotofigens]MBU5613863.1 putative sulfate/molybdate transporter [Geomonas azotofigens]